MEFLSKLHILIICGSTYLLCSFFVRSPYKCTSSWCQIQVGRPYLQVGGYAGRAFERHFCFFKKNQECLSEVFWVTGRLCVASLHPRTATDVIGRHFWLHPEVLWGPSMDFNIKGFGTHRRSIYRSTMNSKIQLILFSKLSSNGSPPPPHDLWWLFFLREIAIPSATLSNTEGEGEIVCGLRKGL